MDESASKERSDKFSMLILSLLLLFNIVVICSMSPVAGKWMSKHSLRRDHRLLCFAREDFTNPQVKKDSYQSDAYG